ncbi:MAG: FG-GAP-like repeat-containing protein [Planctomycetota bacterium]
MLLSERCGSRPRHALPLALLVPLCLQAAGCGGDDPSAPPSGATAAERPDVEDTLRRERVAVHFAKLEFKKALAELQPLLTGEEPLPLDLVRAAQIALRTGDLEGARGHAERALEIDPDSVAALYVRARLAMTEGEVEEGRDLFERVLEIAPDDAASKLGLSKALYVIGEDADLPKVQRLLDEVVALGLPNGLQWYVTGVYRRWRASIDFGDDEETIRTWESLWISLSKEKGFAPASELDLDQGDLARVAPPAPYGTFPAEKSKPLVFDEPRRLASSSVAPTHMGVHDVDGDRTPDVVTIEGGALLVHRRSRGSEDVRVDRLVEAGVTGPFRVLDLNQRRGGDTLDVVAAAGSGLVLMEQSDETGATSWTPSPVALPTFPSTVRDLETVDFDHDGDLDLLVVGDFGARLLRNDGAGARVDKDGVLQPRGAWTDATEQATLPDGAYSWCGVEDFDGDNDVDLLFGGPSGAHLMDSLRRGLFVDVGAAAFGGRAFPREPALADVDGDGRPDLFVPDAARSVALLQRPDGGFDESPVDARVPDGEGVVLCDLDLDGAYDAVWGEPGRFGSALLGLTQESPTATQLPALDGARGPIVVADVDAPDRVGRLALEVVRVDASGVAAVSPTNVTHNALYLKFVGQKDNRQGVGAVVEVRARDLYRRIYLRGNAGIVGVGDRDRADVVRVTWPNGVVQQELDVDAGVQFFLDNEGFGVQPEGLIGSCPFLYAWNGETFEFISDVIGITPLGLPMAPGMLVPPDHDEYVLVRGDQLVPDENGELVLQFTEELREVTYLDRVRLDVIDHPVGTDVYPNERFCFPPFPEPHTHVVERVAPVRRATGSDGRDWTDELATLDFRHPTPFRRLAGQFLGLADPHWLELEFDPADLEGASKLRLVATGWFYWSDASVNVASARTPGVEFVPPMIQVPGPDGTWVPTGPPIGFPAGKTKTMVVDVTEIVPRDDPRIRLGSTLELYWDRVELATCDDDAAIVTTSLEPSATRLWSRGFSAPQVPDRDDLPLFFDWDELASMPRWNQHPGMYTKYGAIDPLLEEVDDRYVIMGSGDALTIRFDASALPPVPEGHVRDYLVFLDGWAKDRDPNTHEALEVEPLPFHGMSGYPYRDDESFPDTPEHRVWRAEWNTRPAHGWVVPMSPIQEAEWIRDAMGRGPEAAR